MANNANASFNAPVLHVSAFANADWTALLSARRFFQTALCFGAMFAVSRDVSRRDLRRWRCHRCLLKGHIICGVSRSIHLRHQVVGVPPNRGRRANKTNSSMWGGCLRKREPAGATRRLVERHAVAGHQDMLDVTLDRPCRAATGSPRAFTRYILHQCQI